MDDNDLMAGERLRQSAHLAPASIQLREAAIHLGMCESPADIRASVQHVLELSNSITLGLNGSDNEYIRQAQYRWSDTHPDAGTPEEFQRARDDVQAAAIQLANEAFAATTTGTPELHEPVFHAGVNNVASAASVAQQLLGTQAPAAERTEEAADEMPAATDEDADGS